MTIPTTYVSMSSHENDVPMTVRANRECCKSNTSTKLRYCANSTANANNNTPIAAGQTFIFRNDLTKQ